MLEQRQSKRAETPGREGRVEGNVGMRKQIKLNSVGAGKPR